MISDELKSGVKALSDDEYDRAVSLYGPFHSAHEGESVLREEIEELNAELSFVKSGQISVWQSVKSNADNLRGVRFLYAHAIYAACEAIQVAAVAKKLMDLNEGD